MNEKHKKQGHHQDDSHRRRRAATTLDNFAHRKGVTKAIQDFHKRKDRKRVDTAKALRQYKKTMKQQGFSPGHGASRKRTYQEDNDDHSDNDVHEDNEKEPAAGGDAVNDESNRKSDSMAENNASQQQPHDRQPRKKKFQKANPFAKALQKSKQHQRDTEQAAKERKQQEREKKQKLFERRKRTQKLRQRTAKGQPVMKHVIHDILRKLERDQETEKEQQEEG